MESTHGSDHREDHANSSGSRAKWVFAAFAPLAACPLFTEYRAPRAEDLDGPTDIPLWIVQRDERLGTAWFESCIRVVP